MKTLVILLSLVIVGLSVMCVWQTSQIKEMHSKIECFKQSISGQDFWNQKSLPLFVGTVNIPLRAMEDIKREERAEAERYGDLSMHMNNCRRKYVNCE